MKNFCAVGSGVTRSETGTLAGALHSQNTDATLAVKTAIESMSVNLTSMLKRILTTSTVS